MLIGVLSDTHNRAKRTQVAVDLLLAAGAEVLVHCGDLANARIVEICSVRPLYFVFGNHDVDMVPELRAAAELHSATCLEWGGQFTVGGKQIAVTHGHLADERKILMAQQPDYLLSGHSHLAMDQREGATRRINPGALFRVRMASVALLDVEHDEMQLIIVPK